MYNENALLVDTGANYSISRLLQELSPISDISGGLLALAAVCAVLAIVLAVVRGLFDFDEDNDRRTLETLARIGKILIFVVILASLGGLASWVLESLDVSAHVEQGLSEVR